MLIPPPIAALVDQLNQELNQTEREATEGLNRVRQVMSRFPNNALLIQFFAYFNAALFFVENSKRRIQTTAPATVGGKCASKDHSGVWRRFSNVVG